MELRERFHAWVAPSRHGVRGVKPMWSDRAVEAIP
jgi:hypothetical protein